MLLIFTFVLFCVGAVHSADSDCQRDVELVCYWNSQSIYESDTYQFTAKNIDPYLCTTIIYNFAGLSIDFNIESLDTSAVIDKNSFDYLIGLKEKNPCLKTTLAIGGWTEGPTKYSVMAYTEESRKSFASNVLRFLTYYGFDGLDLDWEYPTSKGGIPEDGKNFIELLKTIKDTISPWGLTLTTDVLIDDSLLGTAYDAAVMAEMVDYVHLKAYDYMGSASNVTGLLAPLSAIKKTISNWINAGIPANKLILGIPTYGRAYILESADNHDIGDPVQGASGLFTYYQIMEFITNKYSTMVSVEVDDTNYMHGYGEWITYESETTVQTKAQYAIDQNLGGLMVWSIDTDDFQGTYGNKFPILSAIHQVIEDNKSKYDLH